VRPSSLSQTSNRQEETEETKVAFESPNTSKLIMGGKYHLAVKSKEKNLSIEGRISTPSPTYQAYEDTKVATCDHWLSHSLKFVKIKK